MNTKANTSDIRNRIILLILLTGLFMIGCDSSNGEESEWVFYYRIWPRIIEIAPSGIEIPGNRNGETLTVSIFHRGVTVASETRTIINNAVQMDLRWYMSPWGAGVIFDGNHARDFFIGVRVGNDSQLIAPIVMERTHDGAMGWFDTATQLYLFGD